MVEDRTMATLHMTEAELVKNIERVMEQVRQGNEIVIKDEHRSIAVIKPAAERPGRMISEVIADMESRKIGAYMDADFARDIEEGIKAMNQPWDPRHWD